MTILERKAEFVRAILNETDEETFFELERVYHELCEDEPCRYTVEEVKQSAIKSYSDFKAGKGITHEEMKKKYAV